MDSPASFSDYSNNYYARFGVRPPASEVSRNVEAELARQNEIFRRQSAAIFPNVVPSSPAPLFNRAGLLPEGKPEVKQDSINVLGESITVFMNEIDGAMKEKNEFYFIDSEQLVVFQKRLQHLEENFRCNADQTLALRRLEMSLRNKVQDFEAFALALQEQNRMGPVAAAAPVPKAPVKAQDLFRQIGQEAAAKRELKLQAKPAAVLAPEPKPVAAVAPVVNNVAMSILKPKATPVAAPVVAPAYFQGLNSLPPPKVLDPKVLLQNAPVAVPVAVVAPAAPVVNLEKAEGKDLEAQKRIAELETKLKLYEGLVTRLKEHMECPITMEVMKKPVVDQFGHSYSPEGIKEVMDANGKSPIANQEYTTKQVFPNVLLATVFDNINELEANLGKLPK